MAFKVVETDVDGRPSTFVQECYPDEIPRLFLEADIEAGEEVDVIYVLDRYTHEDIELWRRDWMIQKVN